MLPTKQNAPRVFICARRGSRAEYFCFSPDVVGYSVANTPDLALERTISLEATKLFVTDRHALSEVGRYL